MEQQTVIAAYDGPDEARQAFDELLAGGFPRDQVRLGSSEELGSTSGAEAGMRTESHGGQHESLGQKIARFFGLGDDEGTTATYSEAMRRGSTVVIVEVRDETEAQRAAGILSRFDPIDLDQRASEWEAAGWQRPTMAAGPDAAGRREARTAEQSTIPVIEEQLQVGTRVVQSGGVRIFSRVREIPVEERVALREERATVSRHPTDRPVTDADRPFEDKSFEVLETREEPVVAKTARVVEEVVVGKETRRREESVRDKVRRTDVEVQQVAEQPDKGTRQRD